MEKIVPEIKKTPIERFKAIGSLTKEEWEAIDKIMDYSGSISALRLFHPMFDHVRIDPYIRKMVAKIKEVIPMVRT